MSTTKDPMDWDQQEQRREARARAGVMDLLGGFLCLIAGGGIVVGTWLAAGPTAVFIVAWSAIGVGIFHTQRGMYRLTTNWW